MASTSEILIGNQFVFGSNNAYAGLRAGALQNGLGNSYGQTLPNYTYQPLIDPPDFKLPCSPMNKLRSKINDWCGDVEIK